MAKTFVEKYGNLPLKNNSTLTRKVAAHVPDQPVPAKWSRYKYEWPDGMMRDIPSAEHVRYTCGVEPDKAETPEETQARVDRILAEIEADRIGG